MPYFGQILIEIEKRLKEEEYKTENGIDPPEDGAISIHESGGEISEVKDG